MNRLLTVGTKAMNESSVSDLPLEDPEDDLLGISPYTRKLAELIHSTNGSFTIGIYGQWGSGKTSFIQLTDFYLKQMQPPGHLIPFSAWPHRTADELWRALVLTIARALCPPKGKIRPDREAATMPASEDSEPGGLCATIGRFLARDHLTLLAPPPPPDPDSEYNEIVAQLDGTPYGTIGKDSEHRLRIDQDEATMAIVKAALSALGAISPLLAGLRGLLGLGGDLDLSSVIRRDKNEAVRKRLTSVKDFQAIFGKLRSKSVDKQRICVFIDDLDRCLPDVVLDLLEAIKIFLADFPWVFLVAADREVISQGYALRYPKPSETNLSEDIKEYYREKGEQYLEKMIQLHVPVPAPGADRFHGLISAHFPRWAAATDIILLTVDQNPRRVKQYCRWLTYKHSVIEAIKHETN